MGKNINALILVGILALGVLAAGCTKSDFQLEGFAFYTRSTPDVLFEGISPDGVKIKGRQEENYPKQTPVDFWAKAVANYVPQRGYQLIKEGAQGAGKFFIFLVPGSKYDYFYCVYFEVTEDKIHLLEAGGRYALLEKYQQKILEFAGKTFQEKNEKKG